MWKWWSRKKRDVWCPYSRSPNLARGRERERERDRETEPEIFNVTDSVLAKRTTKNVLGYLPSAWAANCSKQPVHHNRARRHTHSIHEIASQSICGLGVAWQAKMASIHFRIPWCSAHEPHCISKSDKIVQNCNAILSRGVLENCLLIILISCRGWFWRTWKSSRNDLQNF